MPAGKTGIEAFAVIRAAMGKKHMVTLGRLVMSTRERVCAIEIEEGGVERNAAAQGYVNDMWSDLTYEVESDLTHGIEEAQQRDEP